MSALKWMLKTFPEEKEEERMRKFLGRYGLTGKQQVGLKPHFHAMFLGKILHEIFVSDFLTGSHSFSKPVGLFTSRLVGNSNSLYFKEHR